MYLEFYGLTKEPFHITPDPDFLFLSPSHKEAFASIAYGVEKRKGFVAVTGEVGTGKTTVLRSYLEQADPGQILTIYLFNPDLTFDDLLRLLLAEMWVDKKDVGDTAELLDCLQKALICQYEKGRNVVLIIDEAQNMPVDTLEKLRMLSNLETTKDKLIEIVLAGQPELERKLASYALRQLKQRIAVHTTIRPLTRAESTAYIRHRTTLAGGNPVHLFTPAAISAIVRRAKGSPRTINILCDNALVTGFGYERRPVTLKIVREVASELLGRLSSPRLKWGLATAGMLALMGSALFAGMSLGRTESGVGPQGVPVAPIARAESAVPTEEAGASSVALDMMSRYAVDVAVAPDTPAPAVAPAAVPKEAEPKAEPSSPEPALPEAAPLAPELEAPTVVAAVAPVLEPGASEAVEATPEPEPALVAPEPDAPTAVASIAPTPETVAEPEPAPAGVAPLAETETVESPELAEEPVELALAEAPPAEATTPAGKEGPIGPTKMLVKKGDYLSQLLVDVYGRTNRETIDLIMRHNPQIADADIILTGDTIVFPELGSSGGGAGPTEPSLPSQSTEDRNSP